MIIPTAPQVHPMCSVKAMKVFSHTSATIPVSPTLDRNARRVLHIANPIQSGLNGSRSATLLSTRPWQRLIPCTSSAASSQGRPPRLARRPALHQHMAASCTPPTPPDPVSRCYPSVGIPLQHMLAAVMAPCTASAASSRASVKAAPRVSRIAPLWTNTRRRCPFLRRTKVADVCLHIGAVLEVLYPLVKVPKRVLHAVTVRIDIQRCSKIVLST
ncbi:unnamed protein product [Peniophora sp. CBMAI 1063]|nr:unnamed protein product [Peniophora sp. CBMAI 1063]